MASDQSNATAALLWVQMGFHPTLVLFFFFLIFACHPIKCLTPFEAKSPKFSPLARSALANTSFLFCVAGARKTTHNRERVILERF